MKAAKVHYIHSLSYRARDKLAGTFVLVALILILGLFISKVNFSTIFDPIVNYRAVMKNAQGIKVETAINISGINVGKVNDIYLGDHNEVNIHFFVYKKYQTLVRADSVGEVSRLSLVGDNIIIIKAGSPHQPMLEDHANFKIKEPEETDSLSLAEITPTIKKFTVIIKQLSEILDAVDPKVIKDNSQNLQTILTDFRKLTNQVSEGKGAIGRILYDKNQEQHLVNSLALIEKSLSGVAQRVEQTGPIIANANQLALESKKLIGDAGQLSSESQRLIADVRNSVSKVDQLLITLPRLISSTESMLHVTERTLNELQPVHVILDNKFWPFSSDAHPVEKSKKGGAQ